MALQPDSLRKHQAGESLTWTCHRLATEPRTRSAALIGMISVLAVGAAFSFSGLVYGLITALVLGGSVSTYLFKVGYVLDREGIEIVHLGWTRRRPWEQFCRVDVCADGVFLSPFKRPSRLDSFRGVFIRWVANRDEVVNFVQRHVASKAV